MSDPMTDEQLAAYLNLTTDEAAILIPKLTPQRRAVYDRMATVEVEVNLWQAGLGPKPAGVLIDMDKPARRRPR